MIRAARLTFRLYRFELVAILAYGLVLAVLALVVAVRLEAVNPGVACLRTWIVEAAVIGPGCADPRVFLSRNEAEGGPVMAAMWLLPLVAGVLAGSVLVAREIEHRTAQFAWSVGPSRRRWYLDRLLPVLAVVILATILPAIAAEVLEGARQPWVDPLASAADFGLRGPVPVALAIAALGIGVLVGALLGRMLPALIVAALLVIALHAGTAFLPPLGMPLAALDPTTAMSGLDGSLLVSSAWRTRDGRILTLEQAKALAPAGTADPYAWLFGDSGLTQVDLVVPARDVWQVEARESVLLLAIGAVGLVAAGVVVERRRPY